MTDSTSTGNRIVRASGLILLAGIFFKLSGVIQLKIMAYYFSARIIETVYAASFGACIFAFFLVGEEIIGPAFLPVFMEQKTRHGESAAWKLANIVLSVQFIVLLIVSALIMLFPESAIRLVTAWSADSQPEKFRLASDSVLWCAPALLCLSLGSTTYMILNGYKRFFLAAFGDASWKLVLAVTMLVGASVYGPDPRILILGIVLGSVAKLATHLLGLLKEIRHVRFSLLVKNPLFRSVLLLMLPLICGILFAKVRDIYNDVWVLSRLKTDGLMQANLYGKKLYGTIGFLIPYTLSIAMFPFLCEMAARNERKQFSEILSQSCRMLLSIFVPMALVCVVLARPLTFFIFKGGEFTSETASLTALSMACYTLVLPAAAVECLLMQAFFANRKMISITVVGIVFSTLSIAISCIGIVVCGLQGAAALAVVALGFVVSRTLKTSALAVLIRPHIEPSAFSGLPSFLLRTVLTGIISTMLCFAAVLGIEHFISAGEGLIILLTKLVAGAAAAMLGFVTSVWLLKIEEPRIMLRWLIERIQKRRIK